MISVYVPIGIKTIHGVESDGMLASGAELGINRDAAGILELDSRVGAFLEEHQRRREKAKGQLEKFLVRD